MQLKFNVKKIIENIPHNSNQFVSNVRINLPSSNWEFFFQSGLVLVNESIFSTNYF